MQETGQDRRARISRQMLKDALVELMKTRSIHEISIKKICETADVNRSTFYRYYDSPYALYDEILKDVGDHIYAIAEKTGDVPHRIRVLLTEILTYVEQHRELILVLLSSNGNLNVGETLSVFVSSFLGGSTELSVYCAQFITAGVTNIVWTWLNKEDRRSPREMALMLNALLLHGVQHAIALSGQ